MRNLFASLTIFFSLSFATSSQAAEEDFSKIDPSKMEDDRAFEKVMQDLFCELNDFIYANRIPSDSEERRAWIAAWLIDLHFIGSIAAKVAASSGIVAQNAAGQAAWTAAECAVQNAIGHTAKSAIKYKAWNAAWDGTFPNQNAAQEAAQNAVKNAVARGAPPAAVGRAARLAAFMVLLKHFKRMFERSYRTALSASEPSMALVNPMTSRETYHQFCEQFAQLSPSDRSALGLHVFASHFTFPQQALTLMNGNINPDSSISMLTRDSIFGIIQILYFLIVFAPNAQGACE